MTDKTPAKKRSKIVVKENKAARADQYEKSYKFSSEQVRTVNDIRTTAEMVAFLESPAGKDVLVEARILHHKQGEGFGYKKFDAKKFCETFKENNTGKTRQFREAGDDFSSGGIGGGYANTVGQDFTPLLGGPFYKQLYYYNDYLKMHQDCFFAMNHDPMGKATVDIMTDFTLGKGFSVEFENETMQAVWDAFEKVNGLQEMMTQLSREISGYGEHMIWKLPHRQTFIAFGLDKDNVPKGMIPRVRLVDPSNIVEIVTYPEDITRVLFYVWLTPTQYQTYTGKDSKTGQVVQGTKLIYQQIPAEQMLHYKVNSASNEKRGRSDLFAALPYFKRLRDSVNYELIKQQKKSAWSIDTTIDGDDADIQSYMDAQSSLGTIPNAGSEFVHTAAIKREYLGNAAGGSSGADSTFEWCVSMICAGTRIPVSYYGTHLSGGQTRASAIVATEPVAKLFEGRQLKVKGILSDLAEYLMEFTGIRSAFEITMPEIITQDRSQKLKDIALGESADWWSPERCAEMASQEMGIRNYDYKKEQEKIREQKMDKPVEGIPSLMNPLTQPGTAPGMPQEKPSAVTGAEKKQIKDER